MTSVCHHTQLRVWRLTHFPNEKPILKAKVMKIVNDLKIKTCCLENREFNKERWKDELKTYS